MIKGQAISPKAASMAAMQRVDTAFVSD